MNTKAIYTMSEEVAYKLGKLDFPHFYDIVSWKLNKEPFPLFYFFDWGFPGGMGAASKSHNGEWITDWENQTIGGQVKFNMIDKIQYKLAYIRGRLSSYSISIKENSISVGYANSYKSRDFLAQCLQDVIYDRFVLEPAQEGVSGRKFKSKMPKYNVLKSEQLGTIPGTPGVLLEADKEIIDYISGR